MTKECKYILSHLKKLSNNSDELLCFVNGTSHIYKFDDDSTFFDYSKYESEIDSIIRSRINDGYLVEGFNQYHFHLTQKALHPLQYNIEDLKKFLIHSIFVPIAVSAITALITVYITLWLER